MLLDIKNIKLTLTQGAYNYPAGSNKKIILNKPLLYNLNVDPSEKYNIAEKNPEVIKKIKTIIVKHKKNLNAPEDLLKHRSFW